MKEDKRPLHIASYGPLTDMASAILLEPEIQNRGVRVLLDWRAHMANWR